MNSPKSGTEVSATAAKLAQFGPIEVQSVARTQVFVASATVKSWTTIPHVTHFDEADTSAIEGVRRRLEQSNGSRVSLLSFIVKAVVAALREFPAFNATLDIESKQLVLKKYYNIGIAVDVPGGLLVPVIRSAELKSPEEIGDEIKAVAQQARTKGLPMDRMEGGSFTISSLGELGGLGFTPIIAGGQVAILGIGRSQRKPVECSSGVEWRSFVPLCLSYDHRVLNGVAAGKFCQAVSRRLCSPQEL